MNSRIQDLDIIRGYALFGILLCNIVLFHHPQEYLFRYFSAHNAWVDGAAAFVRFNYFGDRTFTLFSLLFGIGIGMQYRKRRQLSAPFARYQVTRMGLLLLVGLLHALLVWYGDILAMYALLGVGCLAVVGVSVRWQLLVATLLFLIPTLTTVLVRNEVISFSFRTADVLPFDRLVAMNTLEGVGGHLRYNFSQLPSVVEFYVSSNAYYCYSMMVLGMAGARLGLHRPVAAHLSTYRKVLLLTLPFLAIWTVYQLFFFDPKQMGTAAAFYTYWTLFNLSALAQTGFVVAALVLVSRANTALNAVLRYLGYLGRMSLTNYLLHSVAGLLVFKGLGFYGQSTPALDLAIAIGFTAAQAALSRWWIERYGQGPLEYLWRAATRYLLGGSAKRCAAA